ncbi:MAG: hypothetical protein LKK19_01420 [Bacteroidales bacterium]|jgi:hypothetical protein|nr:hypothetical protein [Bacteroidales bacterium]MCI2121346.1 hypothetical protein [Bacteroidales bacterium]MCI2145253.1 hypothetical protein [Bacteroidales bacterium]
MDNSSDPARQAIVSGLNMKAHLKAHVFAQSSDVFNQFKELLGEMGNDLSEQLETMVPAEGSQEAKVDHIDATPIRLEYRDRGRNEAELRFADDVLIFSLQSNVMQFDRDHPVWKNDYVKKDVANSYCGVISIYNFLSDSIKYNRNDDIGYLVARIFINREKSFFVEGKRQKRQMTSDFGKVTIGREEIVQIIESAIWYTLQFDALVPPFDMVKVSTVEQINAKIESARMRTGKRLGYDYKSDDVLNSEK